jgi:hypothetical protein
MKKTMQMRKTIACQTCDDWNSRPQLLRCASRCLFLSVCLSVCLSVSASILMAVTVQMMVSPTSCARSLSSP